MLKEFKISLIFLLVYFLVLVHIWFPSIGITGLGIPQNNITWFWLILFSSFILFNLSTKESISIPRFWSQGSIAVLVTLLPFAITFDASFFSNGLFLLLGFIVVWIAILLFYQLEILKRYPLVLFLIIFCAAFIQAFWGVSEIALATMSNFESGQYIKEPVALGVFNQRNVLVSFIVTGLMCGYLICLFDSNKNILKHKIFPILLYVMSFLTGIILIFSVSRSGLIGLAISLIVLMPLVLKNKDKTILLNTLLLGVGCFVAYFVAEQFGSMEKSVLSGGARIGYYYTSLMSILEAPLLGHGLGSFQHQFVITFAELYAEGVIPAGSGWHGNLDHPHNELLLWGVQGGLISVAGLIALVLILLKHLRVNSLAGVAGLAVILPIITHAMLEMPFYQSAIHLVILAMLYVALIFTSDKREVEKNDIYNLNVAKFKDSLKVIPVLIIVVAVSVFSLNLYSLNKLNDFVYGEQRLETVETIPVSVGWTDTFNYFYKSSLSRYGMNTGNTFFCQEYVVWAEKTLQVAPKLDYYRNLALAYDCLGNNNKLIESLDRLDYYYPTSRVTQEWIDAYRERLKASQIN